MKKAISVLAILLMLMSCCFVSGPASVLAAEGDFTYKALSDTTAEITGYTGNAKDITIPAEIDGLEVVSIGAQAFYQKTNIDSVVLPDSVSSIGYKAFCASYIKSITMTDSVIEIGNNAFSYCIYLTDVTLSSGLNIISNNAFSSCTRLEEITIPEGISVLDTSAFESCTHLYEINLPSTLTTIGDYALAYTAFDSVTLPEGLTDIHSTAFFQCQNLTEITIPSTVESIGDFAFKGCTSLEKLVIEDGVQKIGNFAFDLCPITEATIPASVTEIGLYAIGFIDNLFDVEKCEDLVITCKKDSVAHTYALDNEFEYILTDEELPPEPPVPTTTEPPVPVPTTTEPPAPVPSTTAPVPTTTTPVPPIPSAKLGDADGNDTVNVKDATAIQKTIAGLAVVYYNEAVADADENGSVNVKDATAIQKWVAGLLTDSNIGK